MEDVKMSVAELLKVTAEEIEAIIVPVKYADTISRPLCQALYNLQICIRAMEAADKKPEEEEKGNV